MRNRSDIFRLAFIVAALLCASCGDNSTTDDTACELTCTGSNFSEAFYMAAFDDYNTNHDNTIRFDGIGTQLGLAQLKEETIDLASSDMFLTEREMAMMKPVIHMPTCIVAVAVVYNLPGVKKLNLSGKVIADIYAGRITRWDDRRISDLNPKVKLPAKDIIPMYRSGHRSITNVFTSYLNSVSEEWRNEHGVAMTMNPPKGVPAEDNAAIAATLLERPYTIGYIGSGYATVLKLPIAAIENACGEFVTPSIKSKYASCPAEIPQDTRIMLVNSPAKGAYPISSFSWLVVYQEQNYNNRTEKQARVTVQLLKFMLTNDMQSYARELGFTPLPDHVIKNNLKNISKITYNGKPVASY